MPCNRPRQHRRRTRTLVAICSLGAVLLAGLHSALAFHEPLGGTPPAAIANGSTMRQLNELADEQAGGMSHLLISEVMAGGASASDEFIEIYNPAASPLPLEGLELVYVTASGGTITRKAAWPAGSAALPSGAHLLVANAAGIFATQADLAYTGGMAATGGSVAIRIQAAGSAIDAVGWGDATSSWLEGSPAAAVSAGHSLERLPGGPAGSGRDTDQNAADFLDNASPDPQGTADEPIPVETPAPSPSDSASGDPTASPPTATPSATELPTPTPTPTPEPTQGTTVAPTVTPSATASATAVATPTPAEPMTISAARAAPDGTTVLVEGVALSDSAFTDGGGYLADATGGIAVLVADGSFARGALLRISGTLDDRFSQRTIRAEASGVQVLGGGADPTAAVLLTGSVGEASEGSLVEIVGQVVSSATVLTSGVAYDVDDGSGPIRVMVGTSTGIDTAAWERGVLVQLRGVVGQRDSSGTGTSGYRVQPRDGADVLSLTSPTASPSPSSSASPSPGPNPGVISIAAARSQPTNARVVVRGVVTLPSGLVEDGTAAIQDATGAIVLRLGDEAGSLRLGELVEVAGTRSTKSGMETLRVTTAVRHLGSQALPDAHRRDTGALGEADEATLVSVRGAVTVTPRRTSADNVYFDVDDGSGPIRIFAAPGAEVDTEHLLAGTTVVMTGVLGQETTGRLPERGYRLWPRRPRDLEIVEQPAGAGIGGATGVPTSGSDGASPGATGGAAGSTGEPRSGHVAQQNRPHLAAQGAVPTLVLRASAVPVTRPPATDAQPIPLAAGLIALGGLLLIGSGLAAGRPELPGLLLAWIRERIRRPADPIDAEAGGDVGERLPVLPRLVPLAVADESGVAGDRAGRAVREERGRILPPT